MRNVLTVITLFFSVISASAHKTIASLNDPEKSSEERLLFGDFNAPVEFVMIPSFNGTAGCRLYRDSTDHGWLFDVKQIANWHQVNDSINKTYAPDRTIRNLTSEQWAEIRNKNRALAEQLRKDRLKQYRVTSRTVSISDSLARSIYQTVKNDIEKAETKPEKDGTEQVEIVEDGTSFTFRCIVEEQLRTLRVHESEQILSQLSDLFRAMIADVEAGRFDEAKYLGVLP